VSRSRTAANPRWSPAPPRSSELDRKVCVTAGGIDIFGAQNVTREREQLSDDVLEGVVAGEAICTNSASWRSSVISTQQLTADKFEGTQTTEPAGLRRDTEITDEMAHCQVHGWLTS
jgi:hypothetical protein